MAGVDRGARLICEEFGSGGGDDVVEKFFGGTVGAARVREGGDAGVDDAHCVFFGCSKLGYMYSMSWYLSD